MDVLIIWLASSVACALGILVVRWLRLGRRPRRADLHLQGLVGLSLLAGTLPVIAYSLAPRHQVAVPAEVLERSVIPDK